MAAWLLVELLLLPSRADAPEPVDVGRPAELAADPPLAAPGFDATVALDDDDEEEEELVPAFAAPLLLLGAAPLSPSVIPAATDSKTASAWASIF